MQTPEQQAKSKAWRQGAGREKRRAVDAKRQANGARREYLQAWQEANKDWGAWWEGQRIKEDRVDIKAWANREARRRRRIDKAYPDTPKPRRFIGGWCIECGGPWMDYAARAHSSRYCSPCAHTYQKRVDPSAGWQDINPHVVFKRDRYRCQICGRKTKGAWPAPTAPTVDHIVPRSIGGDHTYANVQCACWACNSRKGAGAANDQLRLAI